MLDRGIRYLERPSMLGPITLLQRNTSFSMIYDQWVIKYTTHRNKNSVLLPCSVGHEYLKKSHWLVTIEEANDIDEACARQLEQTLKFLNENVRSVNKYSRVYDFDKTFLARRLKIGKTVNSWNTSSSSRGFKHILSRYCYNSIWSHLCGKKNHQVREHFLFIRKFIPYEAIYVYEEKIRWRTVKKHVYIYIHYSLFFFLSYLVLTKLVSWV